MRPHPPVGSTVAVAVLCLAVGPLAMTGTAAPAAPTSVPPPVGARVADAGRLAPVHEVVVTGTDVATYPAFDETVDRYAITTGPDTGGSVTVVATTSDPDGTVLVDGRPTPGGRRTVTGLSEGDEVSVFVDDAAGRATYSFVYLPAEFPTLERTTPAAVAPTFDHVMLTLGLWVAPSPFFETAVDANGVPAVVMTNASGSSMDFKRQPNGNFSVSRGTGNPAYPDSEVVELDDQFREIDRYRATGLQHTDSHDAMLLADGSRFFMSYEPDPVTGRLDAVVQHEAADGTLLFRWDSSPFFDETVAGTSPDYAHVNSFQLTEDDNLLVSFRHFSSVFKIALHDGPGYRTEDVIWRLGGRRSDFTYLEADGSPGGIGPCAQHTATELPNGNILVFDNGSSRLAQQLCVDPADPDGAPIESVPTRMAEWRLDETAHTATLVRDHRVNGRHAIFAGSVQPFDDGSSMVGWASSVEAVATELDPAGVTRWELRATEKPAYFTYRAFALDLPDAIRPVVTVPALPGGGVLIEGQTVRPDVVCRDRGGSSLRTCAVGVVDTRTPGTRTLTVRATDGDGNVTTVRRTYRVVPRHRADASVRAAGTSRFVGSDRYGAAPAQRLVMASRGARRTLRAVVRVRNTGRVPDRFTVAQTSRSRDFVVRLVGARRSPVLAPGRSWTLTLRVVVRRSATPGDRVRVRVRAGSLHRRDRSDVVVVEVVRRR